MFGNDLGVVHVTCPTTVITNITINYSHVLSRDQLNVYRTYYSLDVFNNSQLNMVR